MSMRLYVYKLETDNGGAPCPYRGVLSLALCKAAIRRTAQVGDLVFGFAANSLDRDNRLIYIQRITAVADDGEYYTAHEFSRRPDCIYIDGEDGRFQLREDA